MFPDLVRDDVFRLETARLWLRWPRMRDAQAIAQLAGDKAVAEMTGTIPHPYPPGAAEPFIFEARKGNATGNALTLALTLKGRDQAIGMVGLKPPEGSFEGHCDLELGYWIGKPYWGRGFAPEAAAAAIEAAFTLTGAQTVCASARVINAASRRVIEKCGFTHVGSCLRAFPARGGALAVDRFELERGAWVAMRAEALGTGQPATHEAVLDTRPAVGPARRFRPEWSEPAACA